MVLTNGIRTHLQRLPPRYPGPGQAPTVVFIHGLGADSLASFYLTLAPPLSAAGVDVVTYDLRAHGRTERPASGYRVGDFVADLDGLLAQLGIGRPVHLVGNSFGGTIAFSYAVHRPAAVASIVSIEAEPATQPWAEKMRLTLLNVVEEMTKEENLAWVAQTFGQHHARLARSAGARMKATSIVAEVPQGPLLDLVQLQSIRCPVLSILGSEGFQRDDLGALQSVLPNCRTEVLTGQGHSVLVAAHPTVRDLVLPWLEENEPAGSAPGTGHR